MNMKDEKIYRTAIGQDSHRFVCGSAYRGPACEPVYGTPAAAAIQNTGQAPAPVPTPVSDGCGRKLMLGGICFDGHTPLEGNSDADVVLHSITNAISGITCINILGPISDEMCFEQGITDSTRYLDRALSDLRTAGWDIVNLSISIECSTPKISPRISEMRSKLSGLLGMPADSIGITATTGEGLTAFGRGEGIQAFSCITVCR